MLKAFIPLITSDNPIEDYAKVLASIPAGEKYVQDFDYATIEVPAAIEVRYLEDIYPAASILGADGDIGSWEIAQGSLAACGTFANIAAYASVKSGSKYRLEESIYPREVSPIGLYFVRIKSLFDPTTTTWIAIDSKVPCKPGGRSSFIYLPETGAIAPLLFMKAAATARGGCFDEITNHAILKVKMSWFPFAQVVVETFDRFAEELDRGALCVTSMAQQFDENGNKITPPGVVYGHAFAVVDTIKLGAVELVRIENPWLGGSDFLSAYSEDAPFWDEYQTLTNKKDDAKQSRGNYWVDWQTFLKLAGKTKITMQSPV